MYVSVGSQKRKGKAWRSSESLIRRDHRSCFVLGVQASFQCMFGLGARSDAHGKLFIEIQRTRQRQTGSS